MWRVCAIALSFVSGWRAFSSVSLCNSPTATTAILALMNLIISGTLPDIPSLHASALIALAKPGGRGVRPIAIGEVWVRLASLCAMAACQDAGPALAPLQLGVGVPGGSQSVGHALRSGLSCCPGDVTLQLDFRNAFNSVSRTALLQAVASRAPRLLPFAAWTYRSHGPLVVRGAPADAPPLTSQSGVRQGDPCGRSDAVCNAMEVGLTCRKWRPLPTCPQHNKHF
jgi:hypothetical protein